MSAVPILPVNAVGVTEEGGEYVVTLGSGRSKTMRYAFDDTHFLLLIVEYARAKGMTLPDLPEGIEPKPWTPWVVRGEKQ